MTFSQLFERISNSANGHAAASLAFSMINLVDDGILTIARDGRIVGHNVAFLKLLGYRTSLEGTSLISLVFSADKTAFENEVLGSLNATKSVGSFVGKLLLDSGRYMPFELEYRLEPTLDLILCRVTHQSESARSRDIIQRTEAATGIGTWELDLTSGEIYWSDQTHKIHDTDPSSYQPNLENALTFYHRDSIPTLTEAVNNLMLTGEPYDLRLQLVTAKGREIWIRTSGYAQYSHGTVSSVFGTIQDVNDETARFKDLARFKDIVDLAQEGIVELDSTGQVTYANAKLLSLLDQDRGQVLGTSFLTHILPKHQPTARHVLLDATDKRVSTAEIQLLTATGRVVWCRLHVHRERDPIGPLVYSLAVLSDVTAAKEREAYLLLTNERLSALISNLPVVLISLSPDEHIEWVNENLRTETGWKGEQQSLAEFASQILPHPSEQSQFFSLVRQAPKGWHDFTISLRAGSTIHTSWAVARLSDGRRLLICQNINDRKGLEIEIAQTNQRLEYILEGAALGSWDWDLTTNSVRFDRRWCEMLGLRLEDTPQELSTWDARVHPEDKQQAFLDINAHLEGKNAFYENVHRIKHANGQWVYILDRGRISERDSSGKPTRFTGTHFNITNQKLLELENRMIIDVVGVGIWQYNPLLNTFVWDKSMYRLYEIDETDFSGHVDAWRNSLTDESREATVALLGEAIEGKAEFNTVFQIRTKAGKLKSIEARAKVTRDEHGKAIMMYGLNWDKTFEVELQNSLEQVRAKSVQSAKLALLGEMAGSIAHEINNPLTIIHGKIEQTLRHLAKTPVDGDRVESNLMTVLKTAERIAKIVRGLRTFARQADNDPMIPEDMQSVLSDTLELCQERFRNNNVALRLICPSSALFLGRSAQISQVVMNLLSNAYDAVIDLEEKWVELKVDVDAASVTVRVTDSGKGIPAHVVDDLMKPFFTTKEVGKGTGLGLSIAKSIADEHKASFYYDSASANTSFVLSLPRHIPVAQGGGSTPESSTRDRVGTAGERGAA